jgi:subtilisin family serine protease
MLEGLVRLSFLRSLAGGIAAVSVSLAGCGGGGSSSGGGTVPIVTATATPTPVSTSGVTSTNSATAFTCPSSDGASSVAIGTRAPGEAVRRPASRYAAQATAGTGLIAVTYDRATASSARLSIAARESNLGAHSVSSLDFPHAGTTVHVLSVPSSQLASTESALRTQAGVRSVAPTGERRFMTTVSQPYFPNNPYFDGFATTVAPAAGQTPPPATFHVAPYEESANVPGQWDMHAIGIEHAFAYSQAGNGSGVLNANALGSAAVKIAMIDTGEDVLHPSLVSKVVYQKCYITNTSGTQSVSNFAPDPFGHGTDTAGIAAAATNSGIGFTGAGGNVSLYDYRVFPTPDDNCGNDSNNDPQCGSDTFDVASAIVDAVQRGVNVISISLGGGNCPNGADSDPVEGNAISEAIAANVIVVAASGNNGAAVNAPACDPGVIAAGASALADGQINATGRAGGSASAPVEYVASYSSFGSPGASAKSSSAWGIVAPGGDPSGSSDADDLHWIENIWTSTPYQVNSSDTTFLGECTDDYPNSTLTASPVDCRTLIAGTSMSTPHVAGTAALVLSVNGSYQTPAKMKQLLCSTADDIGDPHEGCGRLNAYRAMAVALGDPTPP